MSTDDNDPRPPAHLDDRDIAALGLALRVDPPGSAARRRMREQVMATAVLKMQVVRAEDGEWKPLLPGVMVKTLRCDQARDTQTQLWRVAPGARVIPHGHRQEEECLVLEGELIYEGQRFGPGDYLLALPGVQHSEFSTQGGALLMLRSEALNWKQRLALTAIRWWRR